MDDKAAFLYLTLRYVPRGFNAPWTNYDTLRTPLTQQSARPLIEDSEDRIISTLDSLISEAVKPYAKPGVGLQLSGGLDSSTLLYYLRQHMPVGVIHTFTGGFGEQDDELGLARTLVDHFKTNHHEVSNLQDRVLYFENAIRAAKAPKRAALWVYIIMREAAKHTSLLLSGEGGDELFGGYDFRYNTMLSTPPNISSFDRASYYLDTHNRDLPNMNLYGKEIAHFTTYDAAKVFQPYFEGNGLNILEQTFIADFNGKLINDFLDVDYSISRHFSIEAVGPLLSPPLIDYAMRIPWQYKYRYGLGKQIIRLLMAERLPLEILQRPKHAFAPQPSTLWNNGLGDMCRAKLTKSKLAEMGIIEDQYVQLMLEDNDLKPNEINSLLNTYALELYLEGRS